MKDNHESIQNNHLMRPSDGSSMESYQTELNIFLDQLWQRSTDTVKCRQKISWNTDKGLRQWWHRLADKLTDWQRVLSFRLLLLFSVGLATPSGNQPATSPGRLWPGNQRRRERGEDRGRHGAETLRQKCIIAVTAGRSWRRQPRVGCSGGVLSVTYAPHGTEGPSKSAQSQVCWRSVVSDLCSSWDRRPK